MEKINKSISFAKVVILSNGSLIVDGGNGIENPLQNDSRTNFGGGAGGVIQIISAMGNLSAHSLSLRRGSNTRDECGNEGNKANGFYYLQGM